MCWSFPHFKINFIFSCFLFSKNEQNMSFRVYSNFHVIKKVGYIRHIGDRFLFVKIVHMVFEVGRKSKFHSTSIASMFFFLFVHKSKVDTQAQILLECFTTILLNLKIACLDNLLQGVSKKTWVKEMCDIL